LSPPAISAIIPTRGDRPESLRRLQEQLARQTLPPAEIIVIPGQPRPGLGRNLGSRQAEGEYLLHLDDDASLDGTGVVAALFEALRSDPRIGLAGAAIAVPPEAGAFQRAYARQFPRSEIVPPAQVTDSDLATTLCCLMPADLFRELGGYREDLIAGEDPELRDRVRRAGYRVVLAPGVRVFHPPPADLRGALRRSFWYGRGDAQIRRRIPPEAWRRSCRPMGPARVLLKALALPLALAVDPAALSAGRLRLRRGGIYVLCGYAHAAGYLKGYWAERGAAATA